MAFSMGFSAAFFMLFCGVFFKVAALAQSGARLVPGLIHVKFQNGALDRLETRINLNDVKSAQIRRLLSSRGFKGTAKIFREALPGDTLAISRTGEIVKVLDLSHWFTIELDSTVDLTSLSDSLRLLPGIAAVSPALLFYPSDTVPNDTYFGSPNYLQAGLYNNSSPGKDIHAIQAWDINRGRNDVKIAVVDGGVDYNHGDLDPGNRSRVLPGKDTGDDDNDPMDSLPASSLWSSHGTSVAGVVGAMTNNGTGVAGVMWNCSIIPIKVASTNGIGPFGWGAGGAFDWDIADGINWARTLGAHVISMSLGGEGLGFWENLIIGNPIGEATHNAYQQGIVLAAAMGNNDNNVTNYPAGYPWVVAVGATNQNDQRVTKASTGNVWGSNYGSHIDLVAPSIGHYSTRKDQSYGYFSGTSCATPFVSGVSGLIFSLSLDRGLNLTNDDVKHLLETSADDIIDPQDGAGTGWDIKTGYGRINAQRALQLINSPYIITQGASVGGTTTLVLDSHTHTFYNNAGLASGAYYGVKQYKVTKHVNFSPVYTQTPYVWVRERQSQGWSYANPNLELRWAKINNVTATGFDVETVVYWIGSTSGGYPINAYYPCAPSQAMVAYTATGIRTPPSVYITGPTILPWKQQGTWTANPSGGNGSYTYEWRFRQVGDPNWSPVAGTSQNYSRAMLPEDMELQIKVTSLGQSVYDTHYVEEGITKTAPPSAEENTSLPEDFSLSQNYPNPFNPETAIRFGLPEEAPVQLVIFDLVGREVRRLVDRSMPAGYHEVIWNGKDNLGNETPSGVYLYQISAGNFRDWKKLALVR